MEKFYPHFKSERQTKEQKRNEKYTILTNDRIYTKFLLTKKSLKGKKQNKNLKKYRNHTLFMLIHHIEQYKTHISGLN